MNLVKINEYSSRVMIPVSKDRIKQVSNMLNTINTLIENTRIVTTKNKHASSEMIDLMLTEFERRRKRGYYNRRVETIDGWIDGGNTKIDNQDFDETNFLIDKFGIVPRMHEFITNGIRGEKNMLKIYKNHVDGKYLTMDVFINILKSAQMIANQIEMYPALKNLVNQQVNEYAINK